jgi:hypothetical protein
MLQQRPNKRAAAKWKSARFQAIYMLEQGCFVPANTANVNRWTYFSLSL